MHVDVVQPLVVGGAERLEDAAAKQLAKPVRPCPREAVRERAERNVLPAHEPVRHAARFRLRSLFASASREGSDTMYDGERCSIVTCAAFSLSAGTS